MTDTSASSTSADSASSFTDLFGDKLVNAAGEEIATSTITAPRVGVYFSAHWCPPCRKFTPNLVAFYNDLKEQASSKPFELVFVSLDSDDTSFKAYMTEEQMPWLAIPFGSSKIAALKEKFGVATIPTLVILNEKGEVVTNEARSQVEKTGPKAYDNW